MGAEVAIYLQVVRQVPEYKTYYAVTTKEAIEQANDDGYFVIHASYENPSKGDTNGKED